MGILFLLGAIILVGLILIIACIYVVQQQYYFIVERLGKFHKIVGPGLHTKIPFVDRIAVKVPLRTDKRDFELKVKTKDNVTIRLMVSIQYHVDYTTGDTPESSGIYRSWYMLAKPIDQMLDYVADALRSSIPVYTLDEVFEKKTEIANDVNETVGQTMQEYGWTLASTLITDIDLPQSVEDSMNEINAAQRNKVAAQDLAEADKIKRVTNAKAEAEAMKQTGIGIADQRKAIAEGLRDSLNTIEESGISNQEANELLMYTQWIEMMNEYAKYSPAKTVVLPSNFENQYGVFSQITAANAAETGVAESTLPGFIPPTKEWTDAPEQKTK